MPSPATVARGDSRPVRPMPPAIEEPVEMDDDPTRGEKRRTSDGAEEPPHKMNSGQAEMRNLFQSGTNEPLNFWCREEKTDFTLEEAEAVFDTMHFFLKKKAPAAELSYDQLSPSEQRQFDEARLRETNGIMDAGAMTLLKLEEEEVVLRDEPDRVLPSRWTEKWKDMGPGMAVLAESRLVVLGFHDPDIDLLFRSAPSPDSESILWVLQLFASMRARAFVADVKVAFMQGLKRQRPRPLRRLATRCWR